MPPSNCNPDRVTRQWLPKRQTLTSPSSSKRWQRSFASWMKMSCMSIASPRGLATGWRICTNFFCAYDAADSSEVWSGFRVARRAHPGPVSCREDDSGCVEVNGSHDGYRRLEGKPVHRRAFRSVPERFTVTDHIEGEFRQARAMFHLHPNVRAACLEEGGGAVLSLAGDREIRITVAGGECRLVETTWHPEFGVSLPSTGLLVRLTGPELVTDFSWR